MNYLKNISKFFVLGVLTLVMTACSNDDDDQNSGSDDVSINITGDLIYNVSGSGGFTLVSQEPGFMEVWAINMVNASPQTYSLDLLLKTNNGEIDQITPGTYYMGDEPTAQTPVFSAIYNHFPDGDFSNRVEFNTLLDGSGVLVIESSTANQVKGTMEVTAHTYDASFQYITGTIEISASFTIYK